MSALIEYFSSTDNNMLPLVLVFLTSLSLDLAFCIGTNSTTVLCKEEEKLALLELRASFVDPTKRLITWSTSSQSEDCCTWRGVQCNNVTGHVTELHLGNQITNEPQPLYGEVISPSLVEFKHLEHLDLSGINFHDATIPSFLGGMASLAYLNLSFSSLGGLIPQDIGNLSDIRYLDLSANHLKGQIPNTVGQLLHLKHLNLSNNQLSGAIPFSLGNLASLNILSVSNNEHNGHLPLSIGNLLNLEVLSIDSNNITGPISDLHFNKTSRLRLLNLTSTSLTFNFHNDWVPPFQLKILSTAMCNVGPIFPTWLQTQKSLDNLYMFQAGIVGKLPPWFWGWASNIDYIDLSFNQIQGDISSVLLNSTKVNLRTNNFHGQLPSLSPRVTWLSVANNSFSGTLSSFLCREANRNNNLKLFHAAMNNISGDLTNCWKYWRSLVYLNLNWNQLSGEIPPSLGSLYSLQALHLYKNMFLRGKIPEALGRLGSIRYIDLDYNQFSGNLPRWAGEKWPNLAVLSMKSNNLTGEIPSELCNLSSLIVLDLGNNGLSGSIPHCLNNLSYMVAIDTPKSFNLSITITTNSQSFVGVFVEYIALNTKHVENVYDKTLRLVRMLDLSSNKLSGDIPSQLFDLKGLRFLNLSGNQLTGNVPEEVGSLMQLEFLDLSRNFVSGKIPESLTQLTYLTVLNLSYNNFAGEIPRGTQLQSFDIYSYIGNNNLCGAPVAMKCPEHGEFSISNDQDDEHNSEMSTMFFQGMGAGIGTGFVGVISFFILKVLRRK